MDEQEVARRLTSITTFWSQVHLAHQGAAPDAAARHQLLQRYLGAVYRYLLGALRDPDTADELFQEFALRFIRGDFKRADPERGRFRDFVKTALINLIRNYRQRKRPLPLQGEEQLPAPAGADPDNLDQEFTARWREDLLTRAWQALAGLQEESGKPYHTVLRLRADFPQLSSTEMAEQLGARLGKSFTPEALRQALHRARAKFAELLIAEVAQSLETDDEDRIEEELLELGLFPYCRGAWKQRGGSS